MRIFCLIMLLFWRRFDVLGRMYSPHSETNSLLQLVVHHVPVLAVGIWPAITFWLSSYSVLHAGGIGRGSGALKSMTGM